MKTQYLTLCLEQADKSPLHYRHGCIVVRGGKVIGQGYNDYRPGFNGGTLKHGRIANGAFDGPALADLKKKLKKQNDKQPKQEQEQQDETPSFLPFEGTGGGHHANVPLSMHSEMMAINSAISASSTMSSTATSYEKPCFKLPRGDKRKARLRQEVLAAYVNEVLSHQGCNNNKDKEEQEDWEDWEDEDKVRDSKKESSHAFHEILSGEKHRHRKKEKKNHHQKDENQYQYQYGRYGQQTQQHGQHQLYASKTSRNSRIRGYDVTTAKNVDETISSSPASDRNVKRKKDYKRSGKMKSLNFEEPAQSQPMLLPKGHVGQSGGNVADRMKHPRLNGADLYVARLGWCKEALKKPKKSASACTNTASPASASPTDPHTASGEDLSSIISSLPSLTSASTSSSGSLHDELINREPSLGPASSTSATPIFDISTVRASRPCYRCITYMHSVGIKRVFWTNDAGEWAGGKVRDLMDALDNSMESATNGDQGGPMGNGVFVTKHEVLMLKRLMGSNIGDG